MHKAENYMMQFTRPLTSFVHIEQILLMVSSGNLSDMSDMSDIRPFWSDMSDIFLLGLICDDFLK